MLAPNRRIVAPLQHPDPKAKGQTRDNLSVKRDPFLPVFGLGAMTFLTGMFAGVHIHNRAL
jgi:hypothetical protein